MENRRGRELRSNRALNSSRSVQPLILINQSISYQTVVPIREVAIDVFPQWLKTADEDDGEGEAPADIQEDQQKVNNFCKSSKSSYILLKTRLLFKCLSSQEPVKFSIGEE